MMHKPFVILRYIYLLFLLKKKKKKKNNLSIPIFMFMFHHVEKLHSKLIARQKYK